MNYAHYTPGTPESTRSAMHIWPAIRAAVHDAVAVSVVLALALALGTLAISELDAIEPAGGTGVIFHNE